MVDVDRLKKDGTTKYVKLLPHSSRPLVLESSFLQRKAIQAVRSKAGVTEEEWSTKWEEIVAEHSLCV